PTCIDLVEKVMKVSSMFGYGEVNGYKRKSTLMRAFEEIDDPKFRYYIVKEKADIYQALKTFFKKEEALV
ncbi:DUF444 family protein, partial [Virgibacillus salexigens]|uniref:DUF444 family protein n=1 Tax=Virgibacillus salexigens TaxID=61016 RepID=UPI00190B7B86